MKNLFMYRQQLSKPVLRIRDPGLTSWIRNTAKFAWLKQNYRLILAAQSFSQACRGRS
jgi:hypothetical protein